MLSIREEVSSIERLNPIMLMFVLNAVNLFFSKDLN